MIHYSLFYFVLSPSSITKTYSTFFRLKNEMNCKRKGIRDIMTNLKDPAISQGNLKIESMFSRGSQDKWDVWRGALFWFLT